MDFRRRKPHFELLSARQRRNNKNEIRTKLESLTEFCKTLKLKIDNITIKELNEDNENEEIEINIIKKIDKQSKNKKKMSFKGLMAKDKASLSNRRYIVFKNTLEISAIPSLYSVIKMKKKLDDFFKLKNNDYGYYCVVTQKIKLVCQQFLLENVEVINDTFIIKLSCDGTTITKSHLQILNFAFTVINDVKKAKTASGNYILGKF
jgi:hypothetical protein